MITKFSTGKNIGADLCKLFGLDPETTIEFTITARADQVTTCDVKQYVKSDAMQTLMSRFKLVPRDAEK